MEDNILTQIIKKGGTISWRGKYFLDSMSYENNNPDKEWSGYEINELGIYKSYHTIYRAINLEEILYYFDNLIDTELRNDFIAHYGE